MKLPLLSSDLNQEFKLHVAKVREKMLAAGADAIILSSSANLFYLTGGVFRGYVYIPAVAEPAIFIIPPGKPAGDRQITIRKPEQIPATFAELEIPMPEKLAVETDDLSWQEVERVRKVFADAEMVNGTAIMRAASITKTDYELEKMREDGRRHTAVYAQVKHCYAEDMTDLEFQIEIEHILRKEGCLGFLRTAGSRMEINLGSVLAGDNADAPSPYDFSMGGAGYHSSLPVGACGMIMKPGMAVMVDMNGGFNGYQTDLTRCWSVGDVSELAQRAHQCSIDIMRDLESFGVPGAEIGEMYRRAVAIAEKTGLKDYFMGHKHKVAFIGHGVGIELNEQPVIMERNKQQLEEGMTLAIEPKFVIPGVGAVGIENTYVVRPNGLENLTPYEESIQQL
jgi:Xaa-Pro aminopeptidase